jgi:hypothetical protein
MALTVNPLVAFNRGLVSPLALARVDLKRLALSAETFVNWMPRALGSMMLRPGLQYIASTRSDLTAKHIPFVKRTISDQAAIELTDEVMRVRIDDTVITRPSVSSAVTNGTFATDLSGWTDADESGAASTWHASGYAQLIGTRFNSAILRQQVTVAVGDQGDEHALRIVVVRGNLTLRVGSASAGDQYVTESVLLPGTHSLAFTPTGDFHIQISNRAQAATLVDSVTVESAGAMEIATPWDDSDLPIVRWAQSADVIFVACDGHQQRRIERRAARSWSVVLYQPVDGPFRVSNITATTLTPSALAGSITLTASKPIFRTGHAGALFRIVSVGQRVEATITAENQFTGEIRVTGVGASRVFTVEKSGTWTANLVLQRSVGEPGSWVDVTTYTTNASPATFDDGLDNQIIYYRLGVKTGDFTSGSIPAALEFSSGGITGIVRVTAYTSETSVSADVLTELGSLSASDNWAEGEWSDYRGWPTAIAFYEGRLWQAGRDKNIGSVSDAFDSFDDTIEGDSGPINRTIGSGPVDFINFLLPLQRLIIGTEGAEVSARSSSFDELLTPTNYNIKATSTFGSAAVAALTVDDGGIFVQQGGFGLFELSYAAGVIAGTADYGANDLTLLVPEHGDPGFTHIAVQRKPGTRIHCLRSDGTVAVLLYHPAEEVKCWVEVETDGVVEDIFVLPGTREDTVYYVVKRTINAVTKRYVEKWALENECQGGVLNKQADSFLAYTGAGVTTITGLTHLEGETVVVWGNGKDLGTKVVASGQITGLSEAVTNAVVGLAYTAQFKSAKLAYGSELGTALTQDKRISGLGLILYNTHAQGLKFGPTFAAADLDSLPLVIKGKTLVGTEIHSQLDLKAISFGGVIDSDARLCLQAAAPRPCTVLAAVLGMDTHDRAP